MQDFHQIKAWQRARALSIGVHKAAVGFARKGHGHLRSHLTRAADGIATSIVDGCGATTHREFARCLDGSIKSANETEHHLLVAHDLALISSTAWQRLAAETVEIRKMIFAYRKKVLESDSAS